MKYAILLLLISLPLCAQATKPPTTLRGILLEQLRTTHTQEDWFAPASVVVAGLTAEQANWSPGHGGHRLPHRPNSLRAETRRRLGSIERREISWKSQALTAQPFFQ